MYRPKTAKRIALFLLLPLCISMLFSCSGLTFKVEFLVDGETYQTVSTKDKSNIDIPKNPTKEGYEFDGWYLDDGKWNDPLTANALLDTPISDDMVLKVYANFIPITEEDSGFLFRAYGGGYEVIGYTGNDPTVAIPSMYKNQPVLAIGRNYSNPNCFANNESIEEVIIPDGVTRISNYAFQKCTNLKKLTIPNSITDMGYFSFSGCINLTDVTLPAAQLVNLSKENLKTIVINGGTSIRSYDVFDCKNLVSVTISESVTSIESGAFSRCESLTTVNLPSGITEISEFLFFGCKNLATITIPDGVTSIGDAAFSGCESLNHIIIPEGVNSIGKNAFMRCRSLTSLTFENPNGWQTTGGREIESSRLSDPASAAEYLSKTSAIALQRK